MYELMAILGHKSIGITINLYGRLRSEDVEDPSPFKFDQSEPDILSEPETQLRFDI